MGWVWTPNMFNIVLILLWIVMCNIYPLSTWGVFGAAFSTVAAKTSKDRITPNTLRHERSFRYTWHPHREMNWSQFPVPRYAYRTVRSANAIPSTPLVLSLEIFIFHSRKWSGGSFFCFTGTQGDTMPKSWSFLFCIVCIASLNL